MRRISAFLTAVALAFGGLATIQANPAAAAITICNTVSDVEASVGGTTGYPTYNNSTVDCDFRLSETYNDAVKHLQNELNTCYGPNATLQRANRNVFTTDLVPDGHYGPLTQAAVQAVQTYLNNGGAGLSVDGYAGPLTRMAMLHVSNDLPSCTNVKTRPPQIVTPAPPPPYTPPPITVAAKQLRGLDSGTCLLVSGTDNGSPAVMTGCSGSRDQFWGLAAVGNGYYQIRNDSSGKCLIAPSWNGNKVIQYDCGPWADQEWAIDTAASTTQVVLHSSGQCLAAPSWASGQAVMVACASYTDQSWSHTIGPPARTDSLDKPVFFIHGFDLQDINAKGWDCGSYWQHFIADFTANGLTTANVVTWGYYTLDGPKPPDNVGCTIKHDGTRDTPIKELGRELANDIYDRYTSKGITVDLVGHSMGGLIMRAALTGVLRHEPGFPPRLFVENAVTLSTPHRGVGVAVFCGVGLVRQCQDMAPDSDLITWLYDNPQGDGGTDWTAIGFLDDTFVTPDSSVPDDFVAQHKIVYEKGQFPSDPLIGAHMTILNLPAVPADGHWRVDYCHIFSSTFDCSMGSRATFISAYAWEPAQSTRYAVYYQHDW